MRKKAQEQKVKENLEEEIKPKKIFSIKLSKPEIVHLRDLFGVALPPDMKSTVSQALAAGRMRHLVEAKLWNKILSLCEQAEIPVGDEAPDFIISLSSPPSLTVFEMVTEDQEDEDEDGIVQGLESVFNGAKDEV